jgi:mono/diheme cytochrome c family protein
MVIKLLGVLACSFVLAVPAFAQDDQLGRQVFERKGNCSTCHGLAATGTPVAPNLRDTVWLNIDGSVAQIIELIRKGVPKPKRHPVPMPPMGGARLEDAEIEAVARYVASLEDVAATNPGSAMGRCAASSRHAARIERPPHHWPAWAAAAARGPAPSPDSPRCGPNRRE